MKGADIALYTVAFPGDQYHSYYNAYIWPSWQPYHSGSVEYNAYKTLPGWYDITQEVFCLMVVFRCVFFTSLFQLLFSRQNKSTLSGWGFLWRLSQAALAFSESQSLLGWTQSHWWFLKSSSEIQLELVDFASAMLLQTEMKGDKKAGAGEATLWTVRD